jgi:hypothetical protein
VRDTTSNLGVLITVPFFNQLSITESSSLCLMNPLEKVSDQSLGNLGS